MNKTTKKYLIRASAAAFAAAPLLGAAKVLAADTGWNNGAGGTFDYNDTSQWVGGNINGVFDSSLTIATAMTLTFGSSQALTSGFTFLYNGANNITMRGSGADRTITLSGDLLMNPVATSRTVTFGSATAGQGLNIDLGGVTRQINIVGSSKALTFNNNISNGGIVYNASTAGGAGGTLTLNAACDYSGNTIIDAGTFALAGSTGAAVNSDFTVNVAVSGTSTLSFLSSTNGNTGTTRAKSVSLNGVGAGAGVVLNVSGNSTQNSVDAVAGTISAAGGFSTITVTPNAARNARLEAAGFNRGQWATMLIRGTSLGTQAITSQAAGVANVKFTNAPALTGAGGANDSTTISILKGAYGDVTTAGSGSGLVTYDTSAGVRLLNATEYTTGITSGQSQQDNVRYSRATGGAVQDTNITSNTTIGSLSFKLTGTGDNTGVTISGDAATSLKVATGVVFASQTVTTATANDIMLLTVPTLDLNGKEGVFITFANGSSNGNTPAPLQISSVISNDGGNGVVFSGTGEVILTGASANTYTGPTVMNSGILRLNKSTTNVGLTTDLIMNGGTLLKNSNSIADTASITINGGAFYFDTTTSSGNNGHAETINNFTMNGGSVNNHGSNAAFTINGNAVLTAGQLGMNSGGDVTVLGNTTLSGGQLLAREASSTTTANGFMTTNNVTINNTASGTYTPIVLNASATNKGAVYTLNGNVTFVGNGTNTSTTRIDTSDGALANQGVFQLNGSRTFDIGNGAAATDLIIVPTLVNGASAGVLNKTGTGTLALTGVNTYSGGTNIAAGTLSATGTLGSGGVVVNGGVLELDAATTINDNASLTLNGGTVNLNFTGIETVGVLTFGGNTYISGQYDAASDPTFFSGTGHLVATPEPSSIGLIAVGALGLLKRRRRRD